MLERQFWWRREDGLEKEKAKEWETNNKLWWDITGCTGWKCGLSIQTVWT